MFVVVYVVINCEGNYSYNCSVNNVTTQLVQFGATLNE